MKCSLINLKQVQAMGIPELPKSGDIIYCISPNETICAILTQGGLFLWHRWDKEEDKWIDTHILNGKNWMLETE